MTENKKLIKLIGGEKLSRTFQIRKLYSKEEIKAVIKRAAVIIFNEYFPLFKKEKGRFRLIFIAILTGATRFRNALSTEVGKLFAKRGYYGVIEEDDICVSTYPIGTELKKPRFLLDTKREIRGAHVIVVEDIIDTGETISLVIEHLKKKGATSIEIYALVDKTSRRRKKVKIDFVGFEIKEDFWVVGYGMDIDGRYRELPYIGYIAGK